MELIMAAKLTIRKECLESEVHFSYNNHSYAVKLSDASQEQLQMIKEVGVDVFETDKAGKKE
jgi:hypothetical protein